MGFKYFPYIGVLFTLVPTITIKGLFTPPLPPSLSPSATAITILTIVIITSSHVFIYICVFKSLQFVTHSHTYSFTQVLMHSLMYSPTSPLMHTAEWREGGRGSGVQGWDVGGGGIGCSSGSSVLPSQTAYEVQDNFRWFRVCPPAGLHLYNLFSCLVKKLPVESNWAEVWWLDCQS